MSEFEKGQKIGGYEILGILGKGGMGTVYRVNQTSMDRIVALKVLDPVLAKKDPSFCERFIDEARAAGRLNHPNIIGVHDVSNVEVDGEKVYYFSMEVVEGENFKDLIEKDGPINLKIVEQVALKISDALIYAEQMKIVHRDIKPENIMITKEGHVKLADLGLALEIHDEEEGTGKEGEDGKVKVMGTPRYMSPEQCRGKAVDHRTDQYCLGGTLFHMATGHPPYEGKSRKDLMRAHVLEPTPDPVELIDLPPAWRELLMRMMAKNPNDRVPNAEELQEAVRQAISGQVYKPARRGMGQMRRYAPKGNNNILLYLIMAVVVLTVLGFMMSNSESKPTPDNPDQNPPQEDEDELARKRARDLIAKHAPSSSASPDDIRKAMLALNDILKQGVIKPSDPGYVIIENELKQLEQDLIEKADKLSNDLSRRLTQINSLINSGKFSESNKLLAEFSEKDRELVKDKYQGSRDLFNNELNSKTDQLLSRIKRADNSGEINNIIKEAKIKQVYGFRRKIIDDAANARKAYVNKMQAQINQKNAASQKREDHKTWNDMIEDLERHRGTHGINAFIATADEASKRLHNDKLIAAAKAYADIGRSARNIDSSLHQYLSKHKPSFMLKENSRSQTVRCTGLDKDHYVILVRNPNQTIKHKRSQITVPVVNFLNEALKNRNAPQRSQMISIYMSYWKHPYAGQYRVPFPPLSKEFPLKDYPQLKTQAFEMPYNKNQYEVDLNNAGLWQAQFQGKAFHFDKNKIRWSIYGKLGGNVHKDPETKLNFQTLAFAPKINPKAEVDLKLRIHQQTFTMIGLRRANKYVRVVLNSNDDALGAVLTAANGKIDMRPKGNAIVDDEIFDDDVRLRIKIDKNSTVNFELNGKDLGGFAGADGNDFKLPGNGPVQLIFQGFKISEDNGTIEILDLEVKHNR